MIVIWILKFLFHYATSYLHIIQELLTNVSFRSEFEKGDQVIVHNIKKAKKIPGTKEEKKYTAPYTVEKVTHSCLIAHKDQNSKATKLPIHLSRIYHSRKQPVS